ncbi:hypothetical protein CPB86DRAFT_878465 [Serendipita vermifera]|nr:hypothetical protein CPB86DRAFT_878465 [Serendipita vermifera]
MEKWKMGEIIAALPVLLYCSLVLFFAGLTQWMWNVHKTVGGVVLGCMLLGGVFYLVTTLMAVVFPSSPFRAPIVRWIYILFHLIFHPYLRKGPNSSVGNSEQSKRSFLRSLTGRLSQIWSAATNLHTYHSLIARIPSTFSQATVQERDQARINAERKHLISDSLAWLAQNISISSDSHDRLLLLADEASRLDESQQTSKKFLGIPWGEIFHLLGTNYVQAAASKELTEEDERDLAILLRCLRNPKIGPVIAPDQQEEYRGTGLKISTVDEENFNGMNPVYTLLRNIEFPVPLSIEQQVKLRVTSLNYTHNTLRSTKQLITLQRDLTSREKEDPWIDVIPLLCEDINSRDHENEQKRVDNLICLANRHRPPIQDVPLELKTWGDPVTVTRPSTLFYRLWCINWIETLVDNNHPHIHAIFRALRSAQKAALRLVDPPNRSDASKLIQSRRKGLNLADTLEALDDLIERGYHKEELNVIIQLLCNDLKGASSPLYKDLIPGGRKRFFESLQNPWLRLIGYAVIGNDKRLSPSLISDIEMPSSIGESFARYLLSEQTLADLSTLPRLRMRFLREFDRGQMKSFMVEALVDVNKLKQLRSEFHQPSLGVDFGGDFLLQAFHSPFSIGDGEYETQYGRIPDFLVHNNDGASEFIRRYSNQFINPYSNMKASTDCISYLLELCRDIKCNPGRLTCLLVHVVCSNLKYVKIWGNPVCVMDLCNVMEVIWECDLGERGTAHITDSYELARLFRECRDQVIGRWNAFRYHELGSLMGQISGKDDFRVKCNEVIHQLTSPPLTIFGLQMRRLITCTRSAVAVDAAAGMLGMYDM